MEKRYELLNNDIKEVNGVILHRIRAVKNGRDIEKGQIGAFIEKEDNLSHEGNSWIYKNAQVYGNAYVTENALVHGNACVTENALVYGNARVCGNALVCDNAKVSGDAIIYANARVCGNLFIDGNVNLGKDAYITKETDFMCIGPIGSRNGYTTFYLTKDKHIMVSCGCFNDTIKKFTEAVQTTYKDNKIHRESYMDIIECARKRLSINS